MRLIFFILIMAFIISGAVAWIAFTPETGPSAGMAHAGIPQMSIGGDASARSAGILIPAFIWQSCTILLAIALAALGVARSNRSKIFWISLGICGGVALSVWVCLFLNYASYLKGGEVTYFLGFPTASAFMIYGVWGAGALLTLLYVIGFRRFIYTPEDEAAYETLLRERAGNAPH